MIPNILDSTNARTKRNSVEAKSNEEMTISFVDKLQTTHERKRNGTSKEEESHVVTSRINKGRGKKNVNFSII